MCNNLLINWCALAVVGVLSAGSTVSAKALEAPPGLFRDLNDEIVGDALIINGTQLFIDDYIIGELKGAKKVLNQPTKHAKNPLIVRDRPWEKNFEYANGTVIYDDEEQLYKMWVMGFWERPNAADVYICYYMTSTDGIAWTKPIINKKEKSNFIFFMPEEPSVLAPGVFKDLLERDPKRRYKMLYIAAPHGLERTWSTKAAYSSDGTRWAAEAQQPSIPFGDTQPCPYWDERLQRYVAYLRYGPPNSRLISRIESEDFVNWSPKVTVIRRTRMDSPLITKHYGMRIMPYDGVYIGLLVTYHGETIKPIPKDKEAWMDKTDLQLAFSRSGLTWMRVGRQGAIPHSELSKDLDWKTIAEEAAFIPWGAHGKDWDWGGIQAFQSALVVGDKIRIYYRGYTGRHWAKYHGDVRESSIGLATLRLDGFVSIDATTAGTMTTKKFVFIGDTLEVNANAKGGSIVVEALDADGKVIEGFSKKDCIPITTDSVRHVLRWKGKKDCHLIQARPIRLRFYLKKAKLYSFTPRIRHKHYVPSYD